MHCLFLGKWDESLSAPQAQRRSCYLKWFSVPLGIAFAVHGLKPQFLDLHLDLI